MYVTIQYMIVYLLEGIRRTFLFYGVAYNNRLNPFYALELRDEVFRCIKRVKNRKCFHGTIWAEYYELIQSIKK